MQRLQWLDVGHDGEATPKPSRDSARRLTLPSVGAWRSLVARRLWVAEVPGSNPGAPIRSTSDGPVGSAQLGAGRVGLGLGLGRLVFGPLRGARAVGHGDEVRGDVVAQQAPRT